MLLSRLEEIPRIISRRDDTTKSLRQRIEASKSNIEKVIEKIDQIKRSAKVVDETVAVTHRIDTEAQRIIDLSLQSIECSRSVVQMLTNAEQEILNEIKIVEVLMTNKGSLQSSTLYDDINERIQFRKENSIKQPNDITDPDDIYCVCRGSNVGEMVECGNTSCPFQWFHTDCIGLQSIPEDKARWLCPYCYVVMKSNGESVPV